MSPSLKVTGEGDPSASPEGRRRPPSLFARVFLINAAILAISGLFLALSPATVSYPISLTEAVVLVAGLSAVLVLNLFLTSRTLAPIESLTALMGRVDILRPGFRVPVSGDDQEVVALTESFNAMLERLEAERRENGRRTLTMQEEERRRVARELHDQVGQTLTALLLQHEDLLRHAPAELQEKITEARETVRSSLDDVRRIASDLRPTPLDDFDLPQAVDALSDQVANHSDLEVARELETVLPELGEEGELVVYRVAQEGLTNVVRHARASRVDIHLEALGEFGARLRLVDDGQGLDGAFEGDGLRGMRERAMLVDADLSIEDRPSGGVEITLDVPAVASDTADEA